MVIQDWPCYVMSVNSTDALQDLGGCCCSCYNTVDAVVLCLWTTSKPPSWLEHNSITERPLHECQSLNELIPWPLPVMPREPRINILFLTLTHYLPESVKITPQMANLASERSIDIYTPNFCRSDLCPGFYSSFLEWFWFWWHHHNDQWWPGQSTGNPLVSLVGFDWVYITINNYLPLPDSNLSQCLDLN